LSEDSIEPAFAVSFLHEDTFTVDPLVARDEQVVDKEPNERGFVLGGAEDQRSQGLDSLVDEVDSGERRGVLAV
jgi:hypothetical protein